MHESSNPGLLTVKNRLVQESWELARLARMGVRYTSPCNAIVNEHRETVQVAKES